MRDHRSRQPDKVALYSRKSQEKIKVRLALRRVLRDTARAAVLNDEDIPDYLRALADGLA